MPYVEYDEVEAICPACGRIFRSEDALREHRQESHAGVEDGGPSAAGADDEVACPKCHHVLASRAALSAHLRDAHPSRKK